ncbi:hypothetical protein [Cupriavidus sp. UYPR2.512]|uniref:hypothetical protein n=1 Tax=Cupriavidus sp. UYPR2.512 TaxID=1080187 RepID=UPI00047740B6|nr:hypothetical protein [Cupriavidus sp. UYPR2.512]UIF88419.1 hypothetical protein KAF44_23620 [Cupriavidus necator]
MISAFFPFAATSDFDVANYRPQAGIHLRVKVTERPWPNLEVGTGGLALAAFVSQPYGYQPFEVLIPTPTAENAPFAKLMQQVKSGFGRTLSRLPQVFGVSRQTLYNWLEGETPKAIYQERLRELAQAASVFSELGIKPSGVMLDRSVADGKSFLQLLSEGADGKETAKKLIRIVQRGAGSRDKLDALLAGRKSKLDAFDIGSPSLDESN